MIESSANQLINQITNKQLELIGQLINLMTVNQNCSDNSFTIKPYASRVIRKKLNASKTLKTFLNALGILSIKKNVVAISDKYRKKETSFLRSASVFLFYLSKHNYDKMNKMWTNYPLIRLFFSGEKIYFENYDDSVWHKISTNGLIHCFTYIIEDYKFNTNFVVEYWNSNQRLQNIIENFSSEEDIVVFLRKIIRYPDLATHYLDQIDNVNVLYQFLEDIKFIKKISLLRQKIIDRLDIIKFIRMPLEQSIVYFPTLTYERSRLGRILQEKWNKDFIFKRWFNGDILNLRTSQNSVYTAIPTDNLIQFFLMTFEYDCYRIAHDILRHSKRLYFWFNGIAIDFSDEELPQCRSISTNELNNSFRKIISHGDKDIIKKIWTESPLLRAWFSGKIINLGTYDLPIWHRIPTDELIKNFEVSLFAFCFDDIVQEIFEYSPEIFKQSEVKQIILTFCSKKLNEELLQEINIIEFLRLILEIIKERYSNDIKNSVILLETRIRELEVGRSSIQQPADMTDTQNQNLTVQHSEDDETCNSSSKLMHNSIERFKSLPFDKLYLEEQEIDEYLFNSIGSSTLRIWEGLKKTGINSSDEVINYLSITNENHTGQSQRGEKRPFKEISSSPSSFHHNKHIKNNEARIQDLEQLYYQNNDQKGKNIFCSNNS